MALHCVRDPIVAAIAMVEGDSGWLKSNGSTWTSAPTGRCKIALWRGGLMRSSDPRVHSRSTRARPSSRHLTIPTREIPPSESHAKARAVMEWPPAVRCSSGGCRFGSAPLARRYCASSTWLPITAAAKRLSFGKCPVENCHALSEVFVWLCAEVASTSPPSSIHERSASRLPSCRAFAKSGR